MQRVIFRLELARKIHRDFLAAYGVTSDETPLLEFHRATEAPFSFVGTHASPSPPPSPPSLLFCRDDELRFFPEPSSGMAARIRRTH